MGNLHHSSVREMVTDIDRMITNCNTALTDTASEKLGKERQTTTPRVTRYALDLADDEGEIRKRAGVKQKE